MAIKSANRNTRGKRGGGKAKLIGLAGLLLLLGGSLAFAGYFIFLRTTDPPLTMARNVGQSPPAGQARAATPSNPSTTASPRKTTASALQALPPHDTEPVSVSPPATTNPSAQTPQTDKPRVAIVVDDMGISDKPGTDFLAIDLPLSFSFLPFTPFGDHQQEQARAMGRDILLHLPLEPTDHKWDPGPGTLLVAMDAATLERRFSDDLGEVPHAMGINNHMGSRFTADRAAMTQLLTLVKKQRLFFLDSLTSSTSVARQLAGAMGVPSAQRAVFLDNQQDPDAIAGQIDFLIQRAREQGEAIGICHPHPATLAALRSQRARLLAETAVVGVSQLVH